MIYKVMVLLLTGPLLLLLLNGGTNAIIHTFGYLLGIPLILLGVAGMVNIVRFEFSPDRRDHVD